jgi:hypothetical protein
MLVTSLVPSGLKKIPGKTKGGGPFREMKSAGLAIFEAMPSLMTWHWVYCEHVTYAWCIPVRAERQGLLDQLAHAGDLLAVHHQQGPGPRSRSGFRPG